MKNRTYYNDLKIDESKRFVGSRPTTSVDSKVFVQNTYVTSKPIYLGQDIEYIEGNINVLRNMNTNSYKGWKVNVVTWADVDKKTYYCWGDYWVKQMMVKHLNKLGCITDVNLLDANITIYLFGSPFNYRGVRPFQYNPFSFNVMWLYSNPEKFTQEESFKYDYIFCLSKPFLDKIKNKHPFIHKEPLFSCSDFEEPKNVEYGSKYDLVMVANARGDNVPYGRDIVKHILQSKTKLKMNIWGHKWGDHLKYHAVPKSWYRGLYWEYNKLNELYRSAKAVVVDGHKDMEAEGFVPMKIFDIFASGGLPIARYNKSASDFFGDSLLQYKNIEELKRCFEIVDDYNGCLKRIEYGKKIALRNNYKDRINTILNSIKELALNFNSINNIIGVPKNDKILNKASIIEVGDEINIHKIGKEIIWIKD